jgi:hypothetical protein
MKILVFDKDGYNVKKETYLCICADSIDLEGMDLLDGNTRIEKLFDAGWGVFRSKQNEVYVCHKCIEKLKLNPTFNKTFSKRE